jgi:hypothetical protein
MLEECVSPPSSATADTDIVSLRSVPPKAAPRPAAGPFPHSTLAQTVNDQVARELADIEAATAALRRAEPGLESWSGAPASSGHKPRPVWLLIGVLWLSTALVTAGAVAAIAALAG